MTNKEQSQRRPENKRRETSFIIQEKKERKKGFHLILAALTGAVTFHLILFALLWIFDVKLPIHSLVQSDQDIIDKPIVVTPADEDDIPPIPDAPEPLPEIEPEPIDPPDPIDLDLEEAIISPEETSVVFTESMLANDQGNADDIISHVALDKMPTELPTPLDDPVYHNTNTVVVKVPDVKDIDPMPDTLMPGTDGNNNVADPMGNAALKNLLAMPGGTLGSTHKATLQADLLFEYDKAELKQTAHIGLILLAALMEKNPETRFIIEGHTDSFGSDAYNRKLSFLRAEAVRKWLSDNGLPLNRVFIRACAADSPIVSTSGTQEEQAANRRVEIRMRKLEEPLPEDAIPATMTLEQFLARPRVEKNPVGPASPAPANTPSPDKVVEAEVID